MQHGYYYLPPSPTRWGRPWPYDPVKKRALLKRRDIPNGCAVSNVTWHRLEVRLQLYPAAVKHRSIKARWLRRQVPDAAGQKVGKGKKRHADVLHWLSRLNQRSGLEHYIAMTE